MNEDITEFKQSCILKWKGEYSKDKRLKYFDDNFQDWFNQIPLEQQEIVLTLLKNFKYYSRENVNKWLKELHLRLVENDNINDQNTIYAFIKSQDGKSNSSNDYWTEYKMINEVNSEICYENMDAISDVEWQYIKNIVIIDDFSGSGKSFIYELEKNKKRYINKNVFFITINIMDFGRNQIKKFGFENKINIVVLAAESQGKAFESDFFSDDNNAKKQICEMSQEIQIPECFRLGFDESQSLVAFYNNTPNNTLGFFWFDKKKYKSIFPRKHDQKPTWQLLQKGKNNRKRANYNNAKEMNKIYE